MRLQFIVTVFCLLVLLTLSVPPVQAHGNTGKVQYLANEALLIDDGNHKLLFDPFFHNDYGTYRLVPQEIRTAIFEGKAPYDGIDAIFVSHAHEDHFDAYDTMKYLKTHQSVRLYAPQQAIDLLRPLADYALIANRIEEIVLQHNAAPVTLMHGELTVEAVRIPHAGWPERNSEIQNIVFRIGSANTIRMMHFGDADPLSEHYQPYLQFWQKYRTDVSFVPFWFDLSDDGKQLLKSTLNTRQAIGVHVPKILPDYMQHVTIDYFKEPGETRIIEPESQ